MLDKDIEPKNLHVIACIPDPSPALLEEILTHPACYPQLKAWVEYVQKTGMPATPPPPPVNDETDDRVEILDPPTPDKGVEKNPVSKRGWKLFKPRSLQDTTALPAKDNRKIMLIAGCTMASLALVFTSGFVGFNLPRSQASPMPVKTSVPPVKTSAPPVSVSLSGDGFTCMVKGKQIDCFGQNNLGQLGAGAPSSEHGGTIVLDKPVKFAAAGADFACASTGVGVTCWGDNRWKMVADNPAPVLPPTKVGGLEGKRIDSLTAGELHACVVSENKVLCWGSDFSGQLGSGREGDQASGIREIVLPPDQIPVQVLASRFGSCVTTKSKQVFCWGSNEGKRLSEGSEQYLALTPLTSSTPPSASSASSGKVEGSGVLPENEKGNDGKAKP